MLDHQAGLFSLSRDWQPNEMKANVLGLAEATTLLNIPVVLTSSIEDGPNGPLIPEVKSLLKNAVYVPRQGEINAWDNADVVKAVKATGRKQIVMAGIVTDVCVAFPALSAVQEGYDVYAVIDASGTFNEGVRDISLARMIQAGVQPMNFFSTVCELARDWRNFPDGSLGELFAKYVPDYKNLMVSYSAKS
ncbi:putative cysteine hydrolase [Basidiobolus meristosporus CBS 931.73]|uniref:Putative cysteine hydrolase n=1 Tax=Basidiobolus meristosporus CBS 931.73 TaxID=1314790 RepID=A0A1Y1XNF2_9FUNG|nr:putative cysteine hydrolase [Basidiobolus meristosporus CBS 931.73]ORX87262.1 putative cysteine hydrolase [Basidiobolus meristosporus CBS 931.73]|eukprot:ORX76096.1 putative cysteine hydrolase [Basidiobolus meristosporus CBS 931.73]